MDAAPPDYSKLIDEYATLDKALAAMKPHETRYKALREQLLALATKADTEPHEALTIENCRYVIAWGPREKQRRIVSMAAVKKRLGLPLFMKLATMTLKALDAHVTEAEQQLNGLTITERTGPRTCSVIPKIRPISDEEIQAAA